MAEFKVLDIGDCDGVIDFNKVKADGIKAVILRCTKKGNVVDSKLNTYYTSAKKAGLKVGVYKYSYALTLNELKKEAESVISALKGKVLEYPVFLDLEYKTQRSKLSKSTFSSFIKTFGSIMTKAGYKFGIYCNLDWYNNVLDSKNLKYDFWIARYPATDIGKIKESIRVKSNICVGWQFTEKYKLNGKRVDMSVFYKDYSLPKKETTQSATKPSSNSSATKSTSKTIDKSKCIKAVRNIAKAEVGYLEKKSNSNLSSKTGNAGKNNYTKYWKDIANGYQGEAWCACFVTWVFVQAFGKDYAKKLLKHYPYISCAKLGTLFEKHSKPKVGDIVIFYSSSKKRFYHTGIVNWVADDGDTFQTIEGNTSNGYAVVSNGGGVCSKFYKNSKLPGTKFCTPDYSIVKSIVKTGSTVYLTVKNGSVGEDVEILQNKLKKLGFKGSNGKILIADGQFGNNTLYAVRSFQKKYGLTIDGVVGKTTWNKLISLTK